MTQQRHDVSRQVATTMCTRRALQGLRKYCQGNRKKMEDDIESAAAAAAAVGAGVTRGRGGATHMHTHVGIQNEIPPTSKRATEN